ncbi:MAG: selenocysteine-specific translation elongation factor [Tepidisphaeraceae bacterium]
MPVVVKSTPQILHAIVGTAGHVDHGKTSLVKNLTGCETDRLPEEKARGMSIDLGFAPCLLEGKRLVGIVDVPGHKDFIRNMVAGAASIDVLLLVVAADDGVMPQTREHVQIVKLLRDLQVLVALTKIDRVSPDLLELARQDVAAFLTQAGFPDAPIIPVSNETGEGISQIRDTIDRLVERVRQRPRDARAFRMNVERVFSLKGYGTVVSGIPVSGQIAVAQQVELLPLGETLTVRTIQTYKLETDLAFANCCTAINVRDIDPRRVARGMTLGDPGVFQPTTELIATLHNCGDGDRFKRRFEARFHLGTAVVDASIKLLEGESIEPGAEALAHLVLAEPLVAAAGDRFLLRHSAANETLGGGTVLSAAPQRFRRRAPLAPRFEQARRAIAQGDFFLGAVLAGPATILRTSELAQLTQCQAADAQPHIDRAVSSRQLIDLGGGACAVACRGGELADTLAKALKSYHRRNPYSWGMSPAHVCQMLGLESRSFAGLAQWLCAAGGLAVKHGRLALASFQPNVSERLLHLRQQILDRITHAGVLGPARGNLMDELSIPEADMQVLSKLLLEDGTVVALDGNFVLSDVLDDCRRKLLALFRHADVVEMNAFRDAVGANRKLAVAMLDAFDAEGFTRRVPAGRVLVHHGAAKE